MGLTSFRSLHRELIINLRSENNVVPKVPIGIFRRNVLPLTETFIKAQADALVLYRPHYFGLMPSPGGLVDASAATLLSLKRSRLARTRAFLFETSGIAPDFLRAIGDIHPALIHAHFAPDGAGALPICSALGVPLVVTLHGYDVTTHDKELKRSLAGRLFLRRRRELWDRASMFLCVSEFIRKEALAAGYPEDKLRVQYIGVDRNMFRPCPQSGEKLVLFAGRLVTKKGCIHLLKAMKQVQQKEPSARLAIIGNGPLRSELERSARDFDLRCEFLGAQRPSSVLDWMKRARLLCMPSIVAPNGDSEGLGMVLLEAQAIGRPVVGFRTGGIPEAVDDGATGLLATTGNEDELATQLLRYLSDEAFWSQSSAQAEAWIEKRFDLAARTRELEMVYDQLVQ
jgi:colanic acid/amylovoran biosynthesis glycosyltransferase